MCGITAKLECWVNAINCAKEICNKVYNKCATGEKFVTETCDGRKICNGRQFAMEDNLQWKFNESELTASAVSMVQNPCGLFRLYVGQTSKLTTACQVYALRF